MFSDNLARSDVQPHHSIPQISELCRKSYTEISFDRNRNRISCLAR